MNVIDHRSEYFAFIFSKSFFDSVLLRYYGVSALLLLSNIECDLIFVSLLLTTVAEEANRATGAAEEDRKVHCGEQSHIAYEAPPTKTAGAGIADEGAEAKDHVENTDRQGLVEKFHASRELGLIGLDVAVKYQHCYRSVKLESNLSPKEVVEED